jgi:hypothetical protein
MFVEEDVVRQLTDTECVMPRICFVISPLGPDRSATRDRADFVLETYIKPACQEADYEALRADHGVGRDIVEGTTTALQNAPMAVAYMGSAHECTPSPRDGAIYWNANVMIEVGYRLASRLPLIFLCDQNSDGELPDLPMNLKTLNVICLPLPDPKNPRWVDSRSQDVVRNLVRQFQEEEQAKRILDSMHATATINASSSKGAAPKDLYYTAASDVADDLFGADGQDGQGARLVGLTMQQFLRDVQKRMHPAQWRAFEQDQDAARSKLKLRASGKDEKQSIATVPIVFEHHENSYYNHRAFLPIIVDDYRPKDRRVNWFNLRVLYLNVTTATETAKTEDGEEYYICRLDPTSDARLPPLKRPDAGIRVFLSYRSDNRAKVKDVYERLLAMSPYVDPFIDISMNKGANWPEVLGDQIKASEFCFLFLDSDDLGPGQKAEVTELKARSMQTGGEYPVVPVNLRSRGKPPELPTFLTRQWVNFDELTENELRQILCSHFPKRCPSDWLPNRQRLIEMPGNGKYEPLPSPTPPPIRPSPPGGGALRGRGEA